MHPQPTALPVRAESSDSVLENDLPCPVNAAGPFDSEADDEALLEQVIAFYRQRLKEHPPALEFLQSRGLTAPDLLDTFEIGFADRALGRALPKPQLAAGKEIRGRLQRLGIYRPTGHAHFSGCMVVPVRTAQGQIAQVYGRKIARHLNDRSTLHMTMPHKLAGGLLNASALEACDEIILTDSVLNALTFWSAGLRNVTAMVPGDDHSVDELLHAFQEHSIGRVLIAYRNTEAGNRAADELNQQLVSAGLQVARIIFPPGLDANDCAVKEGPELLLAQVREAESWEIGDRKQEPPKHRPTEPPAVGVQASAGSAQPEGWTPTSATEPPITERPTTDAEVTDTDVVMTFVDRRYRIRGLDKNHSLDRLKVNVLVSRDDLLHADTLDLYAARARNTFVKQAAGDIYIEEETIKKDLSKILLKLEELHDAQIQDRLAIKTEKPVELTDAERKDALELLQDPHLLDRILADYDRCGLVGEETNKLVSYLACVSRRLPEPLAVMIQSGSGAGKTSLMDATLGFMPPEDQIQYSAMTGQALYYMGQRSMKHKILPVSEEEGVAQAAYALKLLQSDGKLRIASAEKDGDTGRQKTQDYEVEGPVMMFLTTTSPTPDPELQNRCLTLRVNESEAQTAAIHERQRAAYTLEGDRNACQEIFALHQNAQRLLRPIRVVMPWAARLTFRKDQIRMRRDHGKYLALIASITLLHQYQRSQKSRQENGQTVEYIEATLDDIEVANRLAGEILGQSLDDLLPQTRQLLVLIDDYVTQRTGQGPRSEIRFTQRALRETLGWTDRSLRRHLLRLVELEYVLAYRTGRGNERQYQLVYDGEGRDGKPFLLGLIDVSTLRNTEYDRANAKYDDRTGGSNGRTGTLPAPIRRPSGTLPAGTENGVTPCHNNHLRQIVPTSSENGTQALEKMAAS